MGSLMDQVLRIRGMNSRIDEAMEKYRATRGTAEYSIWAFLVEERREEAVRLALMLDRAVVKDRPLASRIAAFEEGPLWET